MATIQGLDNLINKYKKLVEINSLVINDVVNNGVDIANKNYLVRNSQTNMPTINGIIQSDKNGSIIASGAGLTFEEYGTGTIGKNSNYQNENLPKTGIPITGGWVYNYPSKFKRVSKTNEIYWRYYKNGFKTSKGQKSGMQMYNTSRELSKQKVNIVNNVIKNINKGM